MSKKDLIQENEKLRRENEFLLEENKKLLHNLGVKTVCLSETRRVLELENSRLLNRANNPVINLPSGNKLDINSLSLDQLEYLESLSDENINRM